jgi:hypothetical protein
MTTYRERLERLQRDFDHLARDMQQLGSMKLKRVEEHAERIDDPEVWDEALERMIEQENLEQGDDR